jgi:hypothetical protein
LYHGVRLLKNDRGRAGTMAIPRETKKKGGPADNEEEKVPEMVE